MARCWAPYQDRKHARSVRSRTRDFPRQPRVRRRHLTKERDPAWSGSHFGKCTAISLNQSSGMLLRVTIQIWRLFADQAGRLRTCPFSKKWFDRRLNEQPVPCLPAIRGCGRSAAVNLCESIRYQRTAIVPFSNSCSILKRMFHIQTYS